MNWAGIKTRLIAIAANGWGWLGAAIKLLIAFIGALLTIAVAVIVTVWIVFFGEQLLPGAAQVSVGSLTVEQSSAARTAHDSIRTWVLQCIGANSIRDLPDNLQSLFSANAGITFFSLMQSPKDAPKKNPVLQEINAVQLSNSMFSQRIELGGKTSELYLELQYIQWLTILIGLVTTVVVSVSSTKLFGEIETPLGTGLRFLAIFLPALGTAVAAINAFYNPRDDWNKAANTLANLAQLHGQMAVGIWSIKCPGEDENSRLPLALKLDEWIKRYNDIVTIADSNPGSSKQEQPRPQPGSGPGTPGEQPTPAAPAGKPQH